MNVGRLLLRGVVGPLFVGHGTQKLFGWFGGHGIEGTGGFFEKPRPAPGQAPRDRRRLGGGRRRRAAHARRPHAARAGDDHEHDGHGHPQGPRAQRPVGDRERLRVQPHADRGAAALTETGPGSPSVDSALFGDSLKGKGWALAALAAGVAGSYLVTERLVEPGAGARRRRDGRSDARRSAALRARGRRHRAEPA